MSMRERLTNRVSVNLISPAFAPAIIPALETNESVKVDFPWSTWAMTDMFLFSSVARVDSVGRREVRGEREMRRCKYDVPSGKMPGRRKEVEGLPDVSRLAHERVHLIDGEAAGSQVDQGRREMAWCDQIEHR
jgi:hypothetical protein